MKAAFFILAFLVSMSFAGYGQQSDSLTKKQISIGELTNDMKKLVELNIPIEYVDLSTIETVHLNHATVDQLIEVTDPYLTSTIHNSTNVCESLLLHAIFGQANNQLERQKLVEILCKNFLTEERLYILNSTLSFLSEKDFNDTAKKYVARLINSLSTYYYFGLPARFLGTAQITKSIPFLWKIVDTSFKTMRQRDIDVLASLARMNEKKAAGLLAEYYNSSFNKWGDFSTKTGEFWRHFLIAKNLAFSLDSTVLICLIKEFRSIDINYSFRGGDSGFYPAQYLGACIASMIKNYPYEKKDYSLNPKQLLGWLNTTSDIQMENK